MVAPISTTRSAPRVLPTPERTARTAAARAEARHDADLVRRFKSGDQTAFVEIVTRYRGKMFHIALGLLRNRADAEEIAQDTFIRAHRGLADFRGDASLSGWLHCIALNLSRNRYWYFFRRRRHVTSSLDCALTADSRATWAEQFASDAPGPVREATIQEFATHVAACMMKLNAGQREILTLRNVRQHTYQEISRALAIEIGTVKSRIARARSELRLMLANIYSESDPEASPFKWFDTTQSFGD